MNSILLLDKIEKKIEAIETKYLRYDFFSPFYITLIMEELYHDGYDEIYHEITLEAIDKELNGFSTLNKLSAEEKVLVLEKVLVFFEKISIDFDNDLKENEVLYKEKSVYYKCYSVQRVLNSLIKYLKVEIEEKKGFILNYQAQLVKDNQANSDNENIEPISFTTKEKKSKIQINSEINNIAYLFYILKENKIIECQYLAKALSEMFLDENGEPIQNNLFNSYFSKFGDNENPSKASIIDSFVKDYKKV